MSTLATYILPHPPLIFPEIGKGQEREIQRTIDSCRHIGAEIAALQPETVVITTPHATLYNDYFHISPGRKAVGSMKQFGYPSLKFQTDYDAELAEAISAEANAQHIPAGIRGERNPELDHGFLIPLRFVQDQYANFSTVRIGLSGLSLAEHYRFGICVARAIEKTGRRTVLIASGDLSHKLLKEGPYGFAEEGALLDQALCEIMQSADFGKLFAFSDAFCEKAAECGLRSFVIMAGALDGKSVRPELLSYEGPFGVGYACASFQIMGEDSNRYFLNDYTKFQAQQREEIRQNEDPYVKLARLSLETYVRDGKNAVMPTDLPMEMSENQAGVFVSLKKDGQLRGCIGTIHPMMKNVAQEIMRNAISAGTQDPRFPPVETHELDSLIYDVDVLMPPEVIDSPAELDVKKYGVIVSSGAKRGLLLPNLDGVDTVEQQIAIAKRKAGIPEKQPVELQRFEVIRHL